MIRWLAAAFLTLMFFPPAPVRAEPGEASRPEIVGIRIGFAGRYKTGLWTPVEITLRGVGEIDNGRVRLIVSDSDGVPCGVATPLPCPAPAGELASDDEKALASGDTAKALLYTRFGRRQGNLTVELHSSDRIVAERIFSTSGADGSGNCQPALFSDQDLIVTVGPDSLGVEGVVGDPRHLPADRPVVVRVADAAELPDRWYGYESVRMVIISTSDLSVCSSFKANIERIEALEEWVRMGGRLVFCAGDNAQEVLSATDAPLARFAPGRLREMRSLADARSFGGFGDSLASYCGSLDPLRVPRTADGERLEFQIPLLAEVKGMVESGDGGMPLVVRRAVGFGQIMFFAGDLDRAPLANWSDRPLLLRRLLDLPTDESESVEGGSALMHFGYTDLAGQLRSALDRFADIWQVPVSLVMGLIVVYLLAIGPGDYFLLRWMGRRMELTWITFPAVIVLFCVGAYVLAHRSKGDQLRVNQVDLVDVDVESGQLRGTSWANVFSPAMQRYDITFRPSTPDGTLLSEADVLVSWLGLPGKGLGGMDPSASAPTGWDEGYEFSPGADSLMAVPIPIWATKSVTARWRSPISVHPEADLKSSGQIPVGTVTNTLDFPLENCLLAYGNWAYDLGTLEKGQLFDLKPTDTRRELNSLLTGRKQVFDGEDNIGRERVTPYDRESFDVAYILRAMMFFDAAGGQRYTGLSNSYQAFVDLSGLLKSNRAVLIASISGDASSGELGGADLVVSPRDQASPERQTRHDTIVRFVFPVQSE
jgi:hypothetical protein